MVTMQGTHLSYCSLYGCPIGSERPCQRYGASGYLSDLGTSGYPLIITQALVARWPSLLWYRIQGIKYFFGVLWRWPVHKHPLPVLQSWSCWSVWWS